MSIGELLRKYHAVHLPPCTAANPTMECICGLNSLLPEGESLFDHDRTAHCHWLGCGGQAGHIDRHTIIYNVGSHPTVADQGEPNG